MRQLRIVVLGLLVGCGGDPDSAAAPLWAEAPTVPLDLRSGIDLSEVALLDPVRLTVDLFVGDGLTADFKPLLPEGFLGEVPAGVTVPQVSPPGSWTRWSIQLLPTTVGNLTIPGYSVQAGDEKATCGDLELNVVTVLDEAADPAVEAPSEPFPTPLDLLPWVLGAGAVGLLGVGLWWWLRRRSDQAEAASVPLPSHVI